MAELKLIAVFWESEEDECPKDAVITVEDGVVVYIKCIDGTNEVRLLWTELEKLFDFAIDEVDRQGGFDEPLTRVPDKDGIPF
jgi:hypothetical protein